jgi:replicative DNA helicase
VSDATAEWMEAEGLEAVEPAEATRADNAKKMDKERLANVLPGALDRLRRRALGIDKPIELPNWPRLATALGGGLWPGCHILTGGTGTGKSQLALQLAFQAAKQGIPTRYVALELDDLGLVARLLCMAAGDRAGVWWSQLYTGQGALSTHKLDELARAYGAELAALPLYLATDQGPHGWSYDQIEPAVELLREVHPEAQDRPVLLVVDFLQLLTSPEGKREELRETIGRAAYAARHAARKRNAAVLLLSSAARDKYAALSVELDTDGKPTAGHYDLVGMGKESGDIEYAADTAIVLTRNKEAKGELWVAIAKQRAGKGGWFRLVESNGWLMEAGEAGAPGAAAVGMVAKAAAARAKKEAERLAAAALKVSGRSKASEPSGGDDDR